MKKALGAIPKIPGWPKIPAAPSAPGAPPPGAPGAAASAPPGGIPAGGIPGGGIPGGMGVPGGAHLFPGQLIERIKASIARGGGNGIGSDAYIEGLIKSFPLDRYRDADGNVRCPLSKEQRDQLKAAFGD